MPSKYGFETEDERNQRFQDLKLAQDRERQLWDNEISQIAPRVGDILDDWIKVHGKGEKPGFILIRKYPDSPLVIARKAPTGYVITPRYGRVMSAHLHWGGEEDMMLTIILTTPQGLNNWLRKELEKLQAQLESHTGKKVRFFTDSSERSQ